MKFHTHMTLTCDWPPASFHGISRMLPRALPESTFLSAPSLTPTTCAVSDASNELDFANHGISHMFPRALPESTLLSVSACIEHLATGVGDRT